MMTSLADVMQTGVVIGQAAENVYSFACVCAYARQGRVKICSVLWGFSAVSQIFRWTRICSDGGKDLRRRRRMRGRAGARVLKMYLKMETGKADYDTDYML